MFLFKGSVVHAIKSQNRVSFIRFIEFNYVICDQNTKITMQHCTPYKKKQAFNGITSKEEISRQTRTQTPAQISTQTLHAQR